MPEIIPNLHPLLVHFPIALISVSALFHLAAIATRGNPRCEVHCNILAHTTLWLGALAVIPAAIFGWLAFNSVNHDEAGHAAMLIHRSWALGTLGLLAVVAGWDAWRNKVDATPVWWFTGLVMIAWGMVAATAWHGGELVYRHGLGVLSLPVVETDHEHGAMPEDGEHTHAEGVPEDKVHDHQ